MAHIFIINWLIFATTYTQTKSNWKYGSIFYRVLIKCSQLAKTQATLSYELSTFEGKWVISEGVYKPQIAYTTADC